MKVKEFLTEKNWVNHAPNTEKGEACLVTAFRDCYYDLENTAYFNTLWRIKEKIDNLAPSLGAYDAIINWNDKQTSFEPVRQLIEELDI